MMRFRNLSAAALSRFAVAVARHIAIDPEKLSVKMDAQTPFSTLEIDVEIPCEKINSGPFRCVPQPTLQRPKVMTAASRPNLPAASRSTGTVS